MDTTAELGTSSDKTEKSVQLLIVEREILPQAWMWAEPLLQKIWDRYEPRLSLEDIYASLYRDDSQLWLANDSKEFFCAAITEIIKYPLCIVCKVTHLGGEDPDRFLTLLSSIEDWAFKLGVDEMDIEGRLGWKKALAPLGYTKAHVIVSKSLSHRRMN